MHYLRFAWVAVVTLTLVLAMATLVPAQDEGGGDMVTPEAPATAPGGDAAGDEAAQQGQSLAQIMIHGGGAIGYIIIMLSVATVALIVMSLAALRRNRHIPPEVQEQVEQLFKQRKVKEALDLCREDGSLLARVVESGLTKVRGGWPAMEDVMVDVAEEEGLRMQQQVGWFSLIAAVSPMLGLLGTVYGMIRVFQAIEASGGITSVDDFAGNIMTALVTTCLGLVVAIPNVWAYTAFRNKLDRIIMELEIVVGEIMTPFKSLKAAAATPARTAQRPAAASVAAAKAGTKAEAVEKEDEAEESGEAEPKAEAPETTPETAEEPAASPEATEAKEAPEEPAEDEDEADEEKPE